MIVVCSKCSARFQYGDERFQGARSKRFKCPKCATIFEVVNPLAPAVLVPTPVPTPVPCRTPAPLPELAQAASLALPSPTETTARKGRDGMLGRAGLGGALPTGIRFSLAFLTGPHASTVRLLDQPSTIIGREEGDVVIHDPET